MAIFNGKIHYKWSFSIATLNYQRVEHIKYTLAAMVNVGDKNTSSFQRLAWLGRKAQVIGISRRSRYKSWAGKFFFNPLVN